MLPIVTKRVKPEYRKCDMCKEYPEKINEFFYDFKSAIAKVSLVICKKCKNREVHD